jgi:hypothetical protein
MNINMCYRHCHWLLQLPDSGHCHYQLLENTVQCTWKPSCTRTWSVGLSIVPSEVDCIYECGYVGIVYSWQFLGVVDFTTLTPLPLPVSCKLSFSVFCLNMPLSSVLAFALESPNNFFVWILGIGQIHAEFFIKVVFCNKFVLLILRQ